MSGWNENCNFRLYHEKQKMKEQAYEIFIKYINTHSLMSKNAAKKCAYLEIEGRVEELSRMQGMENRIMELKGIKDMVCDI